MKTCPKCGYEYVYAEDSSCRKCGCRFDKSGEPIKEPSSFSGVKTDKKENKLNLEAKLFGNTGKTIKILAIISFCLESGMGCMFALVNFLEGLTSGELVEAVGSLAFLVIPIISWMVNTFIYAFGELVENSGRR